MTDEKRTHTHTIVVHFMDDKTVNVTVPPENTGLFFERMQKGEVYTDDAVDAGIWISERNVRYAHYAPTPIEETIRPQGTQVVESKAPETVEEQIDAISEVVRPA